MTFAHLKPTVSSLIYYLLRIYTYALLPLPEYTLCGNDSMRNVEGAVFITMRIWENAE